LRGGFIDRSRIIVARTIIADCEALNTKASGAAPSQYTFQVDKCIAVKESSDSKCSDIVNNKGKSGTDASGATTADEKDTKGK